MTQNLFPDAYGPHLTADLYGCPPELLSSIDHVYEYLDKGPTKIGMNKVMPPYVFRFDALPPLLPDESGLSGFVIISESHFAVHTYPEKGILFLDIFSCKSFSHQEAINDVVEHFKAENYETNLSMRGKEYPRNIHTVANYLSNERAEKGGTYG